MGFTKVILLMAAFKRVPFMQVGHGLMASPTVKKRWRSTDFGTFAGNFIEFRLLREFLKLLANRVSFMEGILGMVIKDEFVMVVPTYCKIAVAV